MNMSPNSIKNMLAPRVRTSRLEYQEIKQRILKLEDINNTIKAKRNVLGDGRKSNKGGKDNYSKVINKESFSLCK